MPSRKIKKKYIRVGVRVIIYYCLVLGILYTFQHKILYAPSEQNKIMSTWSPVYNKDKKVIAIEQKSKPTTGQDIVVIFHGNAGNAADRVDYKGVLPAQHLIILEYPGYGLRFNEGINKANLVSAGQELIKEIKKKYPGHHITLLGESLGTGVASEVAVLEGIDKLVLITPYTSIAEVAQDKFWYFPVSYLVRDNFNNVEALKAYKGKTLILAAENDEVIPSKFAKNLLNQTPGEKVEVIVKKSGHNSWVLDWTAEDMKKLRNFVSN